MSVRGQVIGKMVIPKVPSLGGKNSWRSYKLPNRPTDLKRNIAIFYESKFFLFFLLLLESLSHNHQILKTRQSTSWRHWIIMVWICFPYYGIRSIYRSLTRDHGYVWKHPLAVVMVHSEEILLNLSFQRDINPKQHEQINGCSGVVIQITGP